MRYEGSAHGKYPKMIFTVEKYEINKLGLEGEGNIQGYQSVWPPLLGGVQFTLKHKHLLMLSGGW